MGSNLLDDKVDYMGNSNSSCPFQTVKIFSQYCTLSKWDVKVSDHFNNGVGSGCSGEFIKCPRYQDFKNHIINYSKKMEAILEHITISEFKRYICPYSIKSGIINNEYTCSAQSNQIQNPVRVNLFCNAYYREDINLMSTGQKNKGCLNAFILCEHFQNAREKGIKYIGELDKCEYYDIFDKTCLIQTPTTLPQTYIDNFCNCTTCGEGKRKCTEYVDSMSNSVKREKVRCCGV